MPTYPLPPGAWNTLDHVLVAGLTPPQTPPQTPPRLTPPRLTPPRLTPPRLTPPRLTPPRLTPPRLTPPHAADEDEAFVIADTAELLLARGVEHAMQRLFSADDAARTAPLVKNAVDAEPLSRWGPEWRGHAVVHELAGRSLVLDRRLWFCSLNGAPRAPKLKPVAGLSLEVPDDMDWRAQIDKVARASVEREDRLAEILTQCDGFWAYFQPLTHLSAEQTPLALEVLDAAQAWATPILMMFKHQLAVRRPVQRNSRIAPMIATPSHGSLPSGHATLSALMAEICVSLLALHQEHPRTQQLDRLARRIAQNRVVAGVHFPLDSLAGYELGRHLAWRFLHCAGAVEAPPTEGRWAASQDGSLSETAPRQRLYEDASPAPKETEFLLSKLWNKAREEVRRQGLGR